jgi:hypothetical protein
MVILTNKRGEDFARKLICALKARIVGKGRKIKPDDLRAYGT